MWRVLPVLIAAFAIVACGGGYNPDQEALKKAAFMDLGQGKFLSPISLGSASSGANFQVRFSLQEVGTLELISFARKDLSQGLVFSFLRQSDALIVRVTAQGQTQDWSSYFSSLDPNQVLALTLDVHNGESPAHILIWEGEKRAELEQDNTLYNTAEDSVDLGYSGAPGVGLGPAWGYRVDNASVIELLVSEPQDSH